MSGWREESGSFMASGIAAVDDRTDGRLTALMEV